MPRSELLELPATGTAWSALKSVADGSLGAPDLCDSNAEHHLRTLAAALVYARTGDGSYGTKARAGVMAAIPTQIVGLRQRGPVARVVSSPAYVLAADFAGLSGTDDATFRTWLTDIRTKDIGGHSVWCIAHRARTRTRPTTGVPTRARSRIAGQPVPGRHQRCRRRGQGHPGVPGRPARPMPASADRLDRTTCRELVRQAGRRYTPVNKPCTKSGVNVDGAIIADISRGRAADRGRRGTPGIATSSRRSRASGSRSSCSSATATPSAWDWSASALRRAAQLVARSATDGGDRLERDERQLAGTVARSTSATASFLPDAP